MSTKFVLALAALSYAPLVVAGNETAYPKKRKLRSWSRKWI